MRHRARTYPAPWCVSPGCGCLCCGGCFLRTVFVPVLCVRRLRLPVLRWLHGNGCRAVWAKGMAKARDPQVADWLRATVQGQAEGAEPQAASKQRKGVRVRHRA